MEACEQRIINGMLKAGLTAGSDEAIRLLDRDVEVIGSPARVTESDLWPAVWALCSALERQFTGRIHINVGLRGPLGQPARLGSRCVFEAAGAEVACLRIFLGCAPPLGEGQALVGDARGSEVRYGSLASGGDSATPESCFALAGYLGFAALAISVGIPAFREGLACTAMTLPSVIDVPVSGLGDLAFLGLGHLGQAYLSLLYFQRRRVAIPAKITLLDGGTFEDGNWHTQVLIEEDSKWLGVPKATYLSERLIGWGFSPVPDQVTLSWGWRARSARSLTAILGFDNFPARRIAAAAGYSWLIEAGLGDSFLQPRLTWHSIPSDSRLASRLFPDREDLEPARPRNAFEDDLRSRSGCGYLTFNQVQASAPAMGLLASAFVWSELLLRDATGSDEPIDGASVLWSPILPYLRQRIPNPARASEALGLVA
jgi:hypothetical protein